MGWAFPKNWQDQEGELSASQGLKTKKDWQVLANVSEKIWEKNPTSLNQHIEKEGLEHARSLSFVFSRQQGSKGWPMLCRSGTRRGSTYGTCIGFGGEASSLGSGGSHQINDSLKGSVLFRIHHWKPKLERHKQNMWQSSQPQEVTAAHKRASKKGSCIRIVPRGVATTLKLQ